jgi:hypothetical protein
MKQDAIVVVAARSLSLVRAPVLRRPRVTRSLFRRTTPRLSPLWTASCCGPSARPPSRTPCPPRPPRRTVTHACATTASCAATRVRAPWQAEPRIKEGERRWVGACFCRSHRRTRCLLEAERRRPLHGCRCWPKQSQAELALFRPIQLSSHRFQPSSRTKEVF